MGCICSYVLACSVYFWLTCVDIPSPTAAPQVYEKYGITGPGKRARYYLSLRSPSDFPIFYFSYRRQGREGHCVLQETRSQHLQSSQQSPLDGQAFSDSSILEIVFLDFLLKAFRLF